MKEVLDYVESMWETLTFSQIEDSGVSIGVPNPFIAPNTDNYEGNLFYWDSYFIILGLLRSDRIDLAKGIVDNFCHLIDRFGLVPMRNRFYDTGISQPPFLTSMILEVYKHTKDDAWLEASMLRARKEYDMYWQDGAAKIPLHKTHEVLNRYCDHHVISATSEHESGWDMTSRFNNRCLDYAPIDLNSLLYKYEIDLGNFYQDRDEHVSKYYFELAQKRKDSIQSLCFDGFYYDFNIESSERSNFLSLAGFFPLWAGIASQEQARTCVEKLSEFLHKGGLSSTIHVPTEQFHQWDYPNGWAPLQWIVVSALQRYGYEQEAKDVATKFTVCAQEVFAQTEKLWEKYDVVDVAVGKNGRYPTQSGFGWTNAVLLLFYHTFFK